MSQSELETILSIAVVLFFLAASINIYWILNGWQIDTIRRALARLVCRWQKDYRVESYITRLRELADE